MSKAILVMDMPDCCIGCPCYKETNKRCGVDYSSLTDKEIINKPDWCSLRPMPEKREEHPAEYYLFGSLGVAFTQGYNACIRQIGGNNETDKETHQST